MDQILHKPEIGTVDTAILLTSTGIFDPRGLKSSTKGALRRVGGLTLFERSLLTLQRAGISHILALVGEEEPELRQLVKQDERIHAVIRWLPIREFPPDNPQTWNTLAEGIQGSCLVLSCQMICTPSFVERLCEKGREGQAVLAMGGPHAGNQQGNPGVVIQPAHLSSGDSPRVFLHDSPDEDEKGLEPGRVPSHTTPAADLIVLPTRLLGISGSWKTPPVSPIRLALEQAAAEGTMQTLATTPLEYVDTRGPDGACMAERTLFQALQSTKGSLDGWVDRYFNRKVSGYLSRLFIRLRLTPNMITILSMVIGLMGASAFALGTHQTGILGALLFQLSVIIDCCDGEVARLTFSESPFGQELDILADNVVHIAIFAGIALGSFIQGPWAMSALPLLCGIVAILANGLSLWCIQRIRFLKSRPIRWRRLAEGPRKKLDHLLTKVANRDFSLIVLLCACLDLLHWFLLASAIGASLFALTLSWHLRRALLSSA